VGGTPAEESNLFIHRTTAYQIKIDGREFAYFIASGLFIGYMVGWGLVDKGADPYAAAIASIKKFAPSASAGTRKVGDTSSLPAQAADEIGSTSLCGVGTRSGPD
jgi:hypothetical protein